MQELITNFGIQPILLVAQIINFLIIFFLLKKFAFKPILKILQDRRKTIAESIKNADDAEKLFAKAEAREKEVLRKAQTEAQNLLEDAKKQAIEIQNNADAHAKASVEKMIADGQKKIEESAKETEQQLTKHVTHLAVEILEKSLQGAFDTKEQKTVLKKAVKKLKI